MKYKVKNFEDKTASNLQHRLKKWLEQNTHIHNVNVNIWAHEGYNFCTITYLEEIYSG